MTHRARGSTSRNTQPPDDKLAAIGHLRPHRQPILYAVSLYGCAARIAILKHRAVVPDILYSPAVARRSAIRNDHLVGLAPTPANNLQPDYNGHALNQTIMTSVILYIKQVLRKCFVAAVLILTGTLPVRGGT
jgi:hypothetical protein